MFLCFYSLLLKYDAVVDPDLRVKGTEGLRVIDASVIVSPEFNIQYRAGQQIADQIPQPFIPSAHTQVGISFSRICVSINFLCFCRPRCTLSQNEERI